MSGDNKKESEDTKRNLAELVSLRRQVTDAQKKENTLQTCIDDLNEQLEEFLVLTAELEEQVGQQQEEITDLKAQLQNTSVQSCNKAAVDRAIAEKAIALRVKDDAVAEAGQAQADLQKSGVLISDLQSQVRVLEMQLDDARRSNPSSTPGRFRDPESGLMSADGQMDSSSFAESPAGKAIKLQLSEKEKLVQYLQDRVADVEMKNKQLSMEKEGLSNTKTSDYQLLEAQIANMKEEAERLAATHRSEMERLQGDMQIITLERDKAMAAGKQAFFEQQQQQALSDSKAAQQRQTQLDRLQKQAGTRTDRSNAPLPALQGTTDKTFVNMLAQMEAVDDDSDGTLAASSTEEKCADEGKSAPAQRDESVPKEKDTTPAADGKAPAAAKKATAAAADEKSAHLEGTSEGVSEERPSGAELGPEGSQLYSGDNEFPDWLMSIEGIKGAIRGTLQQNKVNEARYLQLNDDALKEMGIPSGPRKVLLKDIAKRNNTK